jgi:serine/threonine protein kinase
VAIRTLRGLDMLASINLIHSDLHSANILLDDAGFSKIADFGLCQRLGNTLPGPRGHPKIRAPETLREHRVSQASDIFSLAITLLEMSTLETFARRQLTQQDIDRHLSLVNRGDLFNIMIRGMLNENENRRLTSRDLYDHILNVDRDYDFLAPMVRSVQTSAPLNVDTIVATVGDHHQRRLRILEAQLAANQLPSLRLPGRLRGVMKVRRSRNGTWLPVMVVNGVRLFFERERRVVPHAAAA